MDENAYNYVMTDVFAEVEGWITDGYGNVIGHKNPDLYLEYIKNAPHD